MYWWHNAAQLTRSGNLKCFGFITTNSLPMINNRKIVQFHLVGAKQDSPASPAFGAGASKGKADTALALPLRITFAIPDHPWVDAADGAAVRIAMTVGAAGDGAGRLCRVVTEEPGNSKGVKVQLVEQTGKIFADLTIGADVAGAQPLKASEDLANRGMQLFGAGFIVSPEEAVKLGLGRIEGVEQHIRPYRNGRDIAQSSRGSMVIDLFGLELDELKSRFPEMYQWLLERVKPERDQNNRASYRDSWWIFGEPRKVMRRAMNGLSRFITTIETAKYRIFVFLDAEILPDNKLVNIASDDAFHLGVLSSRIHTVWALAAGGSLEDRPVYNKTRCFEPFPFPVCDIAGATGRSPLHETIRTIAESLDAHRKRQQALHPDLGLTDMYNVLEKLKSGETLTEKERKIHDKGLLLILKQLHDDLDAAVFAAYDWPITLTDEQILEKLVGLNHERTTEEKQGIFRWLRPEYQNPGGVVEPVQTEMDLALPEKPALQPLPKGHTAQLQAVKTILATTGTATADEVATFFIKTKPAAIATLLEDLVELGLAQKSGSPPRYQAPAW